MAKVTIELDTHECEVILKGLDQAFLRYTEVCERVISEYNSPSIDYIEQNLKAMKNFHDVAFKVGEAAKTLPYTNHEVIDLIVNMNHWREKINKIRSHAEEIAREWAQNKDKRI